MQTKTLVEPVVTLILVHVLIFIDTFLLFNVVQYLCWSLAVTIIYLFFFFVLFLCFCVCRPFSKVRSKEKIWVWNL